MTQGIKQGIHLRRGENSGRGNGGWLARMLAAFASCAAMIFAFTEITGFSADNALLIMLAAGGYLCAMYGVTLRFEKQQWFFIAALAVMLLLVLIFRQQVVEGFRLFWNQMRSTYTAGTGRVLPKWQTQLPEGKSGQCLALFALVSAFSAALLCCCLSSRAPTVLAVILPAGVFAAMAAFETDKILPALASLAAAVLVLAYSGWQDGTSSRPVWFGWILCGVVSALTLSIAYLPGADGWAQSIGNEARQAIHSHRYETKYTTLPEGDFTEEYKADDGTLPALEVTMSEPQAMYLRGFTGYTLEDDVWKEADRKVLARNQELLYWLNRDAFFPAAQYAAASAGTDVQTFSVSVRNVGACSRYRYVPFSLRDTGTLIPENLSTDGLPCDAERTYRYSAVSAGAEEIEQVLENLQKSDDDSVRQYRKAESAYRSFLYRNCLQVPGDVVQLLGKYWDEAASSYGSRENLTLPQAQACARAFLERCFPKSGTQEEIKLPLSGAKGTSFQYATVAAMTLRYYGIPARYAEGYVISEQMAAAAEAGTAISVDSGCARAWVEVYQDGIGWIPMELTPGMEETTRQLPDETPDDSEEDSDAEEPEPTEEENSSEQEQSQEPEGGTVTRIGRTVLTGALIALLVLLLLLLALAVRRKILCRRREQKFRQDDTNEAVSRIFADTALLLESLGLSRGNGSMRTLCEPARQRFGEDYALELEENIRLNDRAMFSSHALTREQRDAALKFYEDTIKCLQSHVKWYRRVWIKWIQCLY